MRLSVGDLDDLSLGGVFLATGGGGDPYVSFLLAQRALTASDGVDLISADTLDDDAFVATIGGVGAPSVSLELLPSLGDPLKALRAFEAHVGRSVDALVAFEVGGGNSLVPLIAAAQSGLPVVDGDGMGRALPEAQMMTFPIAGISPTPALAIDYEGNAAMFDSGSAETYERHIRAVTQAMGGMIIAVEHPMSGEALKSAVVRGTLSFSIEIGRILRERRGLAPQLLPALGAAFEQSQYGALVELYTGKVVDYASAIVGGYDVGKATLAPFDGDGASLTIDIRNEYLVARTGDKILASVPDLITVLDYETGTPINAERLRFGQRVTVVGVGCPDYYRTTRALEVVAPRCFGFDFDYVPIEQRV
ncbi:MAG: DUF917 domain-containing protein [Pseudomonadota bacterium]